MNNRSIIALRSFILAVGATTAASFVGVYGVILGATAADMGWLQSTSNAIMNGGQILWGRISDRLGRRRPFLIAGSIILALLWGILGYVRTPGELVIVYSAISLMGAMIAVNWFSLIAESTAAETRGHYLAVINNLASIGTILALFIMSIVFRGAASRDILISFFLASASYIISSIVLSRIKEHNPGGFKRNSLLHNLKHVREQEHFYRYFIATNTQGIFWSFAWPAFPITIVTVMHFSLSNVAILTATSLVAMIGAQFLLGRIVDRVYRPTIIFSSRMLLSLIPIQYAIFRTFPEFIFMELYSGIVGALQNVVMNSYLLDIVPQNNKAEYISILNGFNGLMYFIGALAGGYTLSYFIGIYGLMEGLFLIYAISTAGRFVASLLFARLKETGKGRRKDWAHFSILYRIRSPGSPSGGVLKPK